MNRSGWGLVGLGLAFALTGTGPAQPIGRGRNWSLAAALSRSRLPTRQPHGTVRCFAHVVTDSRGGNQERQAGRRRWNASWLRPGPIPAAYSVPAGTGTPTIAIVDAYGYSGAEVGSRDLSLPIRPAGMHDRKRLFQESRPDRRQADFRATTPVGQGTALDLDMASAMCSNCKIVLVEANSDSFADLAAAVIMPRRFPACARSPTAMGEPDSSSTTLIRCDL